MKSESNEGRLLNDEGKVIYYSGTENFPKVMREYCEAMVKRGLGKIMHTSNASEPKRIPEEDEENTSTQLIKSTSETKSLWKNGKMIAKQLFRFLTVSSLRKSKASSSSDLTPSTKRQSKG